ncbi:uncharacterized protein LOC21392279 isoform X1 [Morus notabilis]|uniref:uncharacterized protein LOC21392279 isoform X1 n=1 Tax=Morus notabilis TaxID=981085 RepID=UPI000CED19F7|nr:uncharacterized protein LOC21392279 isoform X1 [Morus notabilis]
MEDSEKLTALKRAYADVILNTAKEAAARILSSERKALRFQRELFSTKEDALQMLLRLKQMMDSKVNEAETASLSQQRKIEELEAQLQEAEDIVRDLRAELSEVQAQLEKARNNQIQALDKKNFERDVTTQENGPSARNDQTQALHEQNFREATTLENGVHSPGSTFSDPSSKLEPSANSGRNSILKGKLEGSKCYGPSASQKNQCHSDNPGFASLVMSRKEPELYRNGCTQRIRAFERNSLDGGLSISELVDDAKNGTFIGRRDESERAHVNSTSKAANAEPQENHDKLEVSQSDYSHVLDIAFKSFRRKRKRGARYKRNKAPSAMYRPCHQVIGILQEVPGLSCSSTTPLTIDNQNQSENCSKQTTDGVLKDPHSPSSPKLPLDRIEMGTQSGSASATGSRVDLIKPCSLKKATNDDKASLNKSDLTGQESLVAELGVPARKTDVKEANESECRLEAKVSDIDDGTAVQPASNNRFLKYTFCRKRKKEPLSSSEDTSILKRKMGEKQNGSLEPQNSSMLTESSRDSRRLAQVARQSSVNPPTASVTGALISLQSRTPQLHLSLATSSIYGSRSVSLNAYGRSSLSFSSTPLPVLPRQKR